MASFLFRAWYQDYIHGNLYCYAETFYLLKSFAFLFIVYNFLFHSIKTIIIKMKLSLITSATVAGLLAQVVKAATPDEWRSQSIYFLLTDRFARTDNSTTAECDLQARVCFKRLDDLEVHVN